MKRKVVEIIMFDKNNNKIGNKILDTKTVKGLAQINKISELEYDCDAMVRLNDAIADVMNAYAKAVDNIDHFSIYNDYSEYIDTFNIIND